MNAKKDELKRFREPSETTPEPTQWETREGMMSVLAKIGQSLTRHRDEAVPARVVGGAGS